MAKNVYKPKAKKDEKKEKLIEPTPLEKVVEELIKQEEPSKQIEHILTPCSVLVFCQVKKITGLNKDFLQKKYSTKNYPSQTWEEILIKEKISI